MLKKLLLFLQGPSVEMDLYVLKEDFLKIFGTAYPIQSCTKSDFNIFHTPKVEEFIRGPLSELVGTPLPCTTNIVYTCRCVARIFAIGWRLTKEGEESCLNRCMTAFHNKSKCSIRFDASGKIPKHICTTETYFHRRLTAVKHFLGALESNLVTERWKMANEYDSCPGELRQLIVREVQPDVNFCWRTAVMDYILNCAGVLKVPDLLSMLYYFIESSKQSPTDLDLMHVLMTINTVTRSAFQHAVLELNPPGCLCHVKCNGLYGTNLEILEKAYFEQLIPLHVATQICPLSRLSLNIRNTTAVKPKKCINSNLPASASCSYDGASSIKHLKLYLLGNFTNMFVPYSHRAYVTNSFAFTNNQNSSSNARTLNMCIGGRRTCHRMVQGVVEASKQRSDNTPFTDLKKWWTCYACKNTQEWIHKGTCIEKAYEEYNGSQVVVVNKMCRGCKAAISCKHILDNFFSSNLRRVLFLLKARKQLTCSNLLPCLSRDRCIGNVIRSDTKKMGSNS